MKKNRLALSIVTGGLIASFSGAAMATLEWDTCDVERVGAIGASEIVVKVDNCAKDSSRDGLWLNIVNQKNPSLAVLLTGFSLENPVKINAHFDLANVSAETPGADIEVIYLSK